MRIDNIIKSKQGLSRIEMIVAILLIIMLVGLSVPKYLDIRSKCKEGAAQHNLQRLRSAIAVYYGDNRGEYPTDNLGSLVPRYIESIPYVSIDGYEKSNTVHLGENTNLGGWLYINDPQDPEWGEVRINATGTDSDGNNWEEI